GWRAHPRNAHRVVTAVDATHIFFDPLRLRARGLNNRWSFNETWHRKDDPTQKGHAERAEPPAPRRSCSRSVQTPRRRGWRSAPLRQKTCDTETTSTLLERVDGVPQFIEVHGLDDLGER